MRRLLRFGVIGLALAFGAAGAHAIPLNNQAAYAARDQQTQSFGPSAPLIEGRSAFTDGTGASVSMIAAQAIALGVAALVLALSAVGVKALWVSNPTEAARYGELSQPAFGLLNRPAEPSCASADSRSG